MKPDHIFETSWEICNKIGGIYTVVSSKARCIVEEYKDNYILIGPDVWKETTRNPDFLEDETLFSDWKANALEEGIKVRTGRWNIEGRPLVILVDFTSLYARKDEIFTRFWETYRLDSLHGAWDYVEPALFGYTAGQVVRSFSDFYFGLTEKVVAHFHEWMSATGVLYLKERSPHIATCFTTHATTLGRSISGNGYPLYDRLETYEPEHYARSLGVISKNSLETIAAQQADAFTTVSSITGRECSHFFGREPDTITTNGFEAELVPSGELFDEKRIKARTKALDTASTITGKQYGDDALLLITSGRYEFRNKGIDLFIQALGELNKQDQPRDVIAFITIPADHRGPTNVFRGKPKQSNFLTHKLNNWQQDTILNAAAQNELTNDINDRVHLIFVPAYLNGNDGVINLDYYEFLIGMDLSVFPSYYEPWGYTPLESIAYRIPTLTTHVAGFGDWVLQNFQLKTPSVSVIRREDEKDQEATQAIYDIILKLVQEKDVNSWRKETQEVFRKALWKEFISAYYEAWEIALDKSSGRKPAVPIAPKTTTMRVEAIIKPDQPSWKKILVESPLTSSRGPIKELAYNLWWSWNTAATEMFANIAPESWYEHEFNPIALIESLSMDKIGKIVDKKAFNRKVEAVFDEFRKYMDEAKNKPEEMVAYFSMEYGLHPSLQIYSGGLGILAGDYLKQASDSNKNLVAVGLLYRQGYFKQDLSIAGDQIADYKPQKFTQLPLIPVRDEQGDWVTVKIALPGRHVTAKAWKLNVGRIPLYLLDTDVEENSAEDRAITYQLYGGDNEHRLKQEMLLGLGGARLIKTLGLNPDVYHLNEGHSAFSSLERIRDLMEREGLDFDTAVEVIKSSSLFTTHTPVPAGHDYFEEHLMRAYMAYFAESFKIGWDRFMGLGKFNPLRQDEKFSMSVLATRMSQQVNGVSKLHGRVSREMFNSLYPGYYADEVHIGHVTNGVHYFSWTDEIWQKLYRRTFGKEFEQHQPEAKYWAKIYEVPDGQIWENRLRLKRKLIEDIKAKQKRDFTRRHENPKVMLETTAQLKENTIFFGFARRFATYKRAHLLFNNLERLAAIVNNPKRPAIFLFSGKAHPNDKMGQDLIKRIVEISKKPEFIGKIIFLQDYDMTGGKLLTNCVDIWLNTPTRPLEASGTSGEKAVMNGVMNFSVLDGWWAEGYLPEAGWAIEETRTFDNQQFQDELDAEIIYNTLEQEIIPLYYDQDDEGIPRGWVNNIKNTIARIAPRFTMQRMLEDYYDQFYHPLVKTGKKMREDGYKNARDLVSWKQKVRQYWDQISVVNLEIPNPDNGAMTFGDNFKAEIALNIPGLKMEDIGVEILMGNKSNGHVEKLSHKQELEAADFRDGHAIYRCDFPMQNSGVHDYAFRIFPKHPDMVYRMDFPLVKWV